MKFGSLFTGIGGFDRAFENAGMSCEWQAERDPRCLEMLAHHWPNVKRFEDVRHVGRESTEPVDVICGGFPCQDLSVAEKRAGLAGERSGLWFEFARIISELSPRWVVIENVPGLLSSNGGADFAVILRGLVERGYGVAWRVLDAQYFGLAQRRKRVFIVGSLGRGRAAEVLFERESGAWNPAPRRTTRESCAATIVGGATGGRSHSKRNGSDRVTLVPAIALSNRGLSSEATEPIRAGSHGALPMVAHTLRSEGADASEDGTGRGVPMVVTANPIGSHNPRYDLDNDTYVVARSFQAAGNLKHREDSETYVVGALHNGTPGRDASDAGNGHIVGAVSAKWAKGTGGPSGDEVQNIVAFAQNTRDEVRLIDGDGGQTGALAAQPGMKQQNYIAGYGVRRLTPTECERLQGFPDGWTAGQSDSTRYRQLGNAVAVPVVEWLARRIVGL